MLKLVNKDIPTPENLQRNLEWLGAAVKPLLAATAMVTACSAGIAYFYYQKDVKKFEKQQKIRLKKLDKQLRTEKENLEIYQKIITSINKDLETALEGEDGVKVLTKELILQIFDALFYIMKDPINGYGYSKVIKSFRKKRRGLFGEGEKAGILESSGESEVLKEYTKVCVLQTKVLNEMLDKSLEKILSDVDFRKSEFFAQFKRFVKLEDRDLKGIMSTTFTRLSRSMIEEDLKDQQEDKENDFTGSRVNENKKRPRISKELMKKVMRYKSAKETTERVESLFKGVQEPWRKYVQLKFISDCTFFNFGVEEESIFEIDEFNEGVKNRESCLFKRGCYQ